VEVQEAFALDRLLLIPSARPPHKTSGHIAEAESRLEMVRLAIEGAPCLEASDVECARPGPSYTIETLRYFQDRFEGSGEIYFVVGGDAFLEITTWKSYRELFATSDFIVMTRPGNSLSSLEAFVHEHISDGYQFDSASSRYTHAEWCTIHCLSITHLDISATEIRKRVKQGRSIRFLVPDAVGGFIMNKGLYR
jgi:nicotinate-nucleotide adenylyltransferase